MGTHCLLGYKDSEKYKPFYVHFDGYPGHIIPVVQSHIILFGFDNFKKQVDKYPEGCSSVGFTLKGTKNKEISDSWNKEQIEYHRTTSTEDIEYYYIISKNKITCHSEKSKSNFKIDYSKSSELQKEIIKALFLDITTKNIEAEIFVKTKPILEK
jgi:hypothetical protein